MAEKDPRKPECQHKWKYLGYGEYFADAERRQKRGEKQKLCPWCKRYVWEREYFKDGD